MDKKITFCKEMLNLGAVPFKTGGLRREPQIRGIKSFY